MPSADLFLRLLEEKELVSDDVLQAARREIQRSSLPPDAVRISLWLVQGQHITASQAERLLTAATEKADASKPVQVAPPPPRVLPPKSPEPQRPALNPLDNLELAPLMEDGKSKAAVTEPAKRSSVPQDSAATSPRTGLPKEGQTKAPPVAGTKTEDQDKRDPGASAKSGGRNKTRPARANVGGELESLENTMKGPLDALSEREALEANPFDDPTAGPQLNRAAPKKFNLRRFLRNLFRRNKSKVVRVTAADPRHVKLVLISWGIAIVILIGALTVFWALSPGTSLELMQKAEAAAAAGDYRQAIHFYDQFLKYYPDGLDANDVRVLRGLAELRQAEKKATASGDWTPAFDVAKTQVKALPKEYRDSDGMQKFSIALAKIGEGLAQQVRGHPDIASVDRVQSIVDMLESDIPEYNRPTRMIEGIRVILKHSKQAVEGRRELDQTVDVIRAAVRENDVQAAYAGYRGLVQLYPELSDDVRLTDAMKQVSAVEFKVLKPTPQSLAAVHEERPSGVLAAMPLAVQPVKGDLAAGRGKLHFVVDQGTAYGLDAATGKTLWRRFVALDPKLPAVTALSISGPADNDVVLCDPVHQELLRVHGLSGGLAWRLAVKQPIVAEPVRVGKWLLLLTKDQRLLLIDVATGNSPRFFPLPQAVRLPPVVDAARGLIFLVADHSNLIVLDTDQCRQVLHLGHEAGKIAAPPAIVGDFLLLPVNDTPSEATIRVFSIAQGKEDELLRPMQTIPMAGYIDTTPVAVGRGAAVVTAQGGLFALDRNEAGDRLPFQVVASKPAALNERLTHYAIPGGNTFWVADRQLTRYGVDIGERRVVPQAISDLGMKFLQAPAVDGGTMFQVLQKSGMPGVTVLAFDLEKNEVVWQTWLAAPLVAEPLVGPVSGKLTAVTASGGMFRAPLDGLKPLGKPWDPILSVGVSGLAKPLCSLLPLPGEMFAMTSGRNTTQIVIYDPKEQDKQFRWLQSPREIAVAPGTFAGGLLTACVNGQVFLLDPGAQGNMAKPIEPAVKGVNTWEWRIPVAVDDKLAVLCDGDKRLTTIRISADGEKALTEVAVAVTKNVMVSPIAVSGKFVFVVDSTDSLLGLELPNLTPGRSQVLGARAVWGPQRVGKLVVVATEKNHLFAFNEQGQVAWQSDLRYGPLAGAPYLSGDELFLSARGGAVWRISAADGKELGKVDAGNPLGTGPLVIGSRVIVGGHDGSLLEVKKP